MWEIPPRVLRGIVLELRSIYLDKCKKTKFGGVKDGVYTKHEKESGLLKMSGGSWTLNLDDIKDLKKKKKKLKEDVELLEISLGCKSDD